MFRIDGSNMAVPARNLFRVKTDFKKQGFSLIPFSERSRKASIHKKNGAAFSRKYFHVDGDTGFPGILKG
jgi:hypothetical protein